MRFLVLLCSPVPLLTILSEAFRNFPVCIPTTELVPLCPYCMLLLLVLDIFCTFCLVSWWWCIQLASLSPRWPHPLVPSSFDPGVLTIPWKSLLPESPPVHSSYSLHDHSSSVSLTCTNLCPLFISEVLTLCMVAPEVSGYSKHQNHMTSYLFPSQRATS